MGAQTMTINDVPLTVIYQPRQQAISVAYAGQYMLYSAITVDEIPVKRVGLWQAVLM